LIEPRVNVHQAQGAQSGKKTFDRILQGTSVFRAEVLCVSVVKHLRGGIIRGLLAVKPDLSPLFAGAWRAWAGVKSPHTR
jgi:hypothetical protein